MQRWSDFVRQRAAQIAAGETEPLDLREDESTEKPEEEEWGPGFRHDVLIPEYLVVEEEGGRTR